CQQSLNDVTLPQGVMAHPMSIADNVEFLNGQLQLFGAMREDANTVASGKRLQRDALARRAVELRLIIRAQRDTLTSQSAAPSVAAIREKLIVEERIHRKEEFETTFDSSVGRIGSITEEWGRVQGELQSLPDDDLSAVDLGKLNAL